MTEDVASLFSVKAATPPCAASKFELCVENNPPYDCNHAEDSLFYEHRSIDGRCNYLFINQAFKKANLRCLNFKINYATPETKNFAYYYGI